MTPHSTAISWADPQRLALFEPWLQAMVERHGLKPESLRPASADASFRRYFRVDCTQGSRIVMDAPPAHEDCEAFVRIAALMAAAKIRVPEVLDWDRANGFLLLSDLGHQTMLDVIDSQRPQDALALYQSAVGNLVTWQLASRPGVLPAYDDALLRRELQLFPDWYLARHRGVTLDDGLMATLSSSFDAIVAQNLVGPSVYVHRDFMPRNLMVGESASGPPTLGVLDFQDAVHGPVTYDIASLMRDAFLTWEEDFVIEVTIRYWEKARQAGLLDFEGWSQDFGAFYRAVEWMGLQRHLKVAGIFARITLRDGKPKYLADAPRFIAYIRHTAGRYRELKPLLRLIDKVEGMEPAQGFAFGRVG